MNGQQGQHPGYGQQGPPRQQGPQPGQHGGPSNQQHQQQQQQFQQQQQHQQHDQSHGPGPGGPAMPPSEAGQGGENGGQVAYQQPSALFGNVPFSTDERGFIKRSLGMQLGPEFVATRQGPGGAKLSYVEGWKIVNLANEIFGFDGWSSQIINTTVDFCEVDARGISLGCSCTVRVTLKDGTFREDVGWGSITNAKDKGQAFEKVRKEAATDALKRSLKNFGNALGNCVYDKDFCKMIPKIKTEHSGPLDPNNLLRPSDLKDYGNVRTDGLAGRIRGMEDQYMQQQQQQQHGRTAPPQLQNQPPQGPPPHGPNAPLGGAQQQHHQQQQPPHGPPYPNQGPPPQQQGQGYGQPHANVPHGMAPGEPAARGPQGQQLAPQPQQQQQQRPGPPMVNQRQGGQQPGFNQLMSPTKKPVEEQPEFDSLDAADVSFGSDGSEMIIAGDMETVDDLLLVGNKKASPSGIVPSNGSTSSKNNNNNNATAQTSNSAPPSNGSLLLSPGSASANAEEQARAALERQMRAQAAQREWQQRNLQKQQNQGEGSLTSPPEQPAPMQQQPQPIQQQPVPHLAPPKPQLPVDVPMHELATPPAIALNSQLEANGGAASFEAKFTSASHMVGGPGAGTGAVVAAGGFAKASIGLEAKGSEHSLPAPLQPEQPQPAGAAAAVPTPRGLRSTRRGGGATPIGNRPGQAPFKVPSMVVNPNPAAGAAPEIKPFSAPGPMQGLVSPSKKPGFVAAGVSGSGGNFGGAIVAAQQQELLRSGKRSFDQVS